MKAIFKFLSVILFFSIVFISISYAQNNYAYAGITNDTSVDINKKKKEQTVDKSSKKTQQRKSEKQKAVAKKKDGALGKSIVVREWNR